MNSSGSQIATYPDTRAERSRFASVSRLRRWMYASRVRGSSTRACGYRRPATWWCIAMREGKEKRPGADMSAQAFQIPRSATRGTLGTLDSALRKRALRAALDALRSALSAPRRRRMLFELRLDHRLRHRPDDLIHDFPILEKEQHRNRSDIEPRRRFDVRVDVHLRDFDSSLELDGELIEDRRDDATGAAPRGPEIDDSEAVVLLDLLLEGRVGDRHGVGHARLCPPVEVSFCGPLPYTRLAQFVPLRSPPRPHRHRRAGHRRAHLILQGRPRNGRGSSG